MDDDDFIRMRYSEAETEAKANAAAAGVSTSGKGTVLLLRPFMTYNMASGILMKGGLDTGFTAHGHHDFMLTDDVIHKVHIGHYTFYHKSIVKQPKNLMIAEDIFASSYVSGEGTNLFKGVGDDKTQPAEGSFPTELAQDRFTGDLIAIWIPEGRYKISNPLDITGHYSAQTLDIQNSTLDNSQEHYPNSAAYADALGFDRLQNYGSQDQFLSPVRHLNTVCFRGHQLSYDANKKTYSRITLNTGHWGPNVYPGCRAVRNGENAFLKDMEYEKARTAGQLGL